MAISLRRMLRWRRWALAIVLGMVTSVLVAAAVGWSEPGSVQFHVSGSNTLLKRVDASGWTMYQNWLQGETEMPQIPGDPWELQRLVRESEYGVPTTSALYGNLAWLLEWNSEEWGWPMRCLWTWHAGPFGGAVIDHGPGIRLADRRRTMPGTPRFIPLMPIWSGLAVNTALFGGVWWLLLVIIPATRAVVRKRRGLCIKCGYDLRGSMTQTCPECGTASTRV